MRITRALLFVLVSITLSGAANSCANRVKPDAEASAISSGDETGLIEGCGQQLVSGLTYCRKEEGDATDDTISFVAPPTKCLGDGPCVSFKIYFPGDAPAYGDTIAQGQTRKTVPWKALTGKSTFDLGDRGFWPFQYWIKWLDPDGREETTIVQGELLLRVYKKGYTPLASSPNDPNFVWSWMENGVPVKMTTGGRVYVGKK